MSDPDKHVLKAYGAYGPKKLYGKEVVGVIRSTFIVDADGRIERAAYNVKATGHVAKLRRDLGLDSPGPRPTQARQVPGRGCSSRGVHAPVAPPTGSRARAAPR